MGRKLDALFGRTFKASKFKNLLDLAISRLAVLKNKRQVCCNQARGDVSQLLQMGHQERALLRVEQVVKEQNMFDALVMMEGYCNLLIERVSLIESQKECPSELKEAVSGLMFASSRCGDFPEVQQARELLTGRYGRDFIASAIELRNQCGVHPKIIQKMSTRQPSLESKLDVIKEIAAEKGITLDLEEHLSGVTEDLNMSQKTEDKARPNRSNTGAADLVNARMEDDVQSITGKEPDDELSGSMNSRKYADVASAAQAAFESAAQAALAARAAVELSKSEPYDSGSDDQSGRGTRRRNIYEENRDDTPLRNRAGYGIATAEKVERFDGGSEFEKIHPIQHSSSETEDEEPPLVSRNILPGKFEGKPKEKLERSASAASLDSTGTMNEAGGIISPTDKAIFDESDEETQNDLARIPSKPSKFHSNEERILLKEVNTRRASYGLGKNYVDSGGELSEENEGIRFNYANQKQNMIRSQADSMNMQHEEYKKMGQEFRNDGNAAAYLAQKQVQRSEMGKKPISMRTRRGF